MKLLLFTIYLKMLSVAKAVYWQRCVKYVDSDGLCLILATIPLFACGGESWGWNPESPQSG